MPGSRDFFDMLDEYNAAGDDDRRRIEAQIHDSFHTQKAVIAIDMSGFTSTVQEFGIVHYLSMIRRMNVVADRIVSGDGGRITKTNADNLTAVFDDATVALESTMRLFDAFIEDNRHYEASRHIRASAGIAWGDILAVPGYDVNGDAVNLSYKLGEDIAVAGEIILDRSAHARLPEAVRATFEAVRFEVADVTIDAYRRSGTQ